MTDVVILGSGPAGLAAAHAVSFYWPGGDVRIVSEGKKSDMFGAQYLHEPIPGIDAGQPRLIKYQLRGTVEQYRAKVYGEGYEGHVSPETEEGDHLAHDIRLSYDKLWSLYSDRMVTKTLTPDLLREIIESEPDAIFFNTIPMPKLCDKMHTFRGQDVWAVGDATDRKRVPFTPPADTVICNGEDAPSWYRASNVFGYATVEWTHQPPIPGASRVRKPLDNNCTCFKTVTRLGRFGIWRKGILVHHAFEMALDRMIGNLAPEDTRPHLHPCPMADDKLAWDTAIQLGCRCE